MKGLTMNPTSVTLIRIVTILISYAAMFWLLASTECAAQITSGGVHASVQGSDRTFWALFHQGGFMMWVMLAVSMFALSLIIESAAKLRSRVIAPTDLFDQLRVLIAQG